MRTASLIAAGTPMTVAGRFVTRWRARNMATDVRERQMHLNSVRVPRPYIHIKIPGKLGREPQDHSYHAAASSGLVDFLRNT